MVEKDHRLAAEDLEYIISTLQSNPRAGRTIIENAWGAAFHWIAYGCQQKHQQHRENHQGLVAYLRGLGEADAATLWSTIEYIRQGGWYGTKSGMSEIQEALNILGQVRTWATT